MISQQTFLIKTNLITMRITLLIAVFMLCFANEHIYSQAIPFDSLYFAQPRPGDSAVVFAPGLISKANRKEVCITFSPDGKALFFSIEFWPNPGIAYTMYSEYKNDHWTTPINTPFTAGRMTNEPFFAFNGSRIYLSATLVQNQVGAVDLSYVVKNDTLWSNPISMGNPPNTVADQYHCCIVSDTSVYFSMSNGLIAKSKYSNGVYQPRVILSYPVNYANTTQTWGDPYASPDESYMVFKSTRTGGFGGNDLYITYRKTNGKWTNPKNLGGRINTQFEERSGDVTPDGLYMTFGSNDDLKWVSTSFINTLRQTNFAPYLQYQIPNITDTMGHNFVYTIPDSTFIDDDGNNTLTYTATLKNGSPLPSYIGFNPAARTFTVNPAVPRTDSIKVTVTDTANANATCIFVIKIIDPTGIHPSTEQITGYKLYQNYPNPFNPITTIKFSIAQPEMVTLRVYDMLGKEIENLYSGNLKAGTYTAEFNTVNLASGIYFYTLKTNTFFEKRKMVVLK